MSFGVLALPKVNNLAQSASCGPYTKTGTTPSQVTGLSVTINLTGRPVLLALIPDGSANAATLGLTLNGGTGAVLRFHKNGVGDAGVVALGSSTQIPSLPWTIDTFGSVGSTTYVVNAVCNSALETLNMSACSLIAFEL